MTTNLDLIFRILRTAIGIAIMILGYMNESWIGVLGIFLIFSGISGKCPIGTSNCSIEDNQRK